MSDEKIELPVKFFNSLVEYLDSCAKESALAAHGVRAVIEKYTDPNMTGEDAQGEAPEKKVEEDNVLSFPEIS